MTRAQQLAVAVTCLIAAVTYAGAVTTWAMVLFVLPGVAGAALLARNRSAEIDASYAAYDDHPLDEPDEWGDLESFRRAGATS